MAAERSRTLEPRDLVQAQPSALDVAGRYAIAGEIARGGMGVVYRVHDAVSGEERALKRVLLRDARHRDVYRAAFEREYQVLASLDHPRIVRVYEYGVDHEGPYYTMELVRGDDLRKNVPRPWREACSLMRDLASSLSLLHARRLVYRDLSPGNVKVTSEGHCKLLDFGALVDFGRQKWVVGTPPSVAPEALRGESLDQRADLFALGALAYWMLTGRQAFPASGLDELPDLWEHAPRPLAELVADLPDALSQLVAELLSIEPLARPSSAAEVIAKLNVVAKLAPEPPDERRRVAQSFLTVPPFVGRARELAVLEQHVRAGLLGRGSAVRIAATAGAGRTRLLDEVALRAQLSGATALRVDASMQPGQHGVTRALVLRLLDLLPDLALGCAGPFHAALRALGDSVEARLPAPGADANVEPQGELWAWIVAVSKLRPLLIAVDNVEHCDAASVALLVAVARQLRDAAIVLVVVERVGGESRAPASLCAHSEPLALGSLVREDVRALARSLFGETSHVERFADWLHDRTAGSPLYALELVRQLVAREVIQYESGYWVLPLRLGEIAVALPGELEDALSLRLSGLSPQALELVQALSLLRTEPSLALCRLLVQAGEPRAMADRNVEQETVVLLDALSQQAILVHEHDTYRFGSTAMREATLAGLEEFSRLALHTRIGNALAEISKDSDVMLRLEAGWHLIRGGAELSGAELVSSVMAGSFHLPTLGLRNYALGPAAEDALQVYTRHRRSGYERVPLLGAVAQAALHEGYAFCERYADGVLDVLDDVSGMRLARRLRAWIGRRLALFAALLFAFARFCLVPKRERPYSFADLLGQLGNCVCTYTGAAALVLDPERCAEVAAVLEPLSVLPEWSTGRGVHTLCRALKQTARDDSAEARATFEVMVQRFRDPAWYRLLPASDRRMCIATATYGRAGLSVFRADGAQVLEDADALEASGLHAYTVVAPHLRFLYYAERGELALAAPHRAQAERQASHVDAVWQAELWVAAALLPLNLALGDLMSITHITHRMQELSRIAPSMHFYRRLSELAMRLARGDFDAKFVAAATAAVGSRGARSFIGWSALIAMIARTHNSQGRHELARATCEGALSRMSDADRDYVGLFLQVDLETAVADAGLGHADLGLARVDGLLRRHAPSGHPLALGLLHETRAQVALRAGLQQDYQDSLREVERLFRATGTPALIAKIERLGALQRPVDKSRARPSQQLCDDEPVSTMATEVSGSEARTVRGRGDLPQ